MNLDKFNKLDAILICGLPGAGKSEFAMQYFNDGNRKRINRGEIRKFMFKMTNFGKEWTDNMFNEHQEYLVKYVEGRIVEYFLSKNHKILIDNTGVTRNSRKSYVEDAKALNKTVGIIFINTPVKECIERVKENGSMMDMGVISNLYAKMTLPKNYREEGFKEGLIIDNYKPDA